MVGPTFASPPFGEMRERPAITAPASKPSHQHGGWKDDGLGALLHLSCFAFAGILTIYAFFLVGFDLLPHPRGEITSVAGGRDPQGDALAFDLTPASPPGLRVDMQPPPQPAQPGPSRQPGQPAQPLVLAAAFAPPPEPYRLEVAQNLAAKPPENASTEIVSGPVTEIRDGMTWVIGGQIVHLWGIRPDSRTPTLSLVRFGNTVTAEGPVSCRRQPHSTRYRCLTAGREDIAEMALFSGIGRAAGGAPVAYKDAREQPRASRSKH